MLSSELPVFSRNLRQRRKSLKTIAARNHKSKALRGTTLLDAFGGVDDHWVELITGNLEALPTIKIKRPND
ncbi:hypothetical protein YC2023_065745 [Brassica napus]